MIGRNSRASRQRVENNQVSMRSGFAFEVGAWDPISAANTAAKQLVAPIGTALAISNDLSGASDSARRWGGSRNSATRTSDSLSLAQAANLIAAAQFAAAIGLPLNRHLTVHWEQVGIPDERAAWATGRLMKLAGDWLAKRGERFAWEWSRENGDGKGSHAHILLHLPPGMQLGNVHRRWLRSITGRSYSASTVKTARIGGTAGAAHSASDSYRANLAAVVGYILKGTNPTAARELGLDRIERGGRIIGKRAATSQNIGRAARARLALSPK